MLFSGHHPYPVKMGDLSLHSIHARNPRGRVKCPYCPKTLCSSLAFAFGLRLRSKTRCLKARVLGRTLPNGKPQERLRFRGLRSKTLAIKKRIAIAFGDLKTSIGARACVQVLCVQKKGVLRLRS